MNNVGWRFVGRRRCGSQVAGRAREVTTGTPRLPRRLPVWELGLFHDLARGLQPANRALVGGNPVNQDELKRIASKTQVDADGREIKTARLRQMLREAAARVLEASGARAVRIFAGGFPDVLTVRLRGEGEKAQHAVLVSRGSLMGDGELGNFSLVELVAVSKALPELFAAARALASTDGEWDREIGDALGRVGSFLDDPYGASSAPENKTP